MAEVNAVIRKEHYTTTIQSLSNTLIADEGTANGGQGAGFNPEELLAASLAACTSITLRMYADRKGFPVDEIHVNIKLSRDTGTATTTLHRHITINGGATEEQRARMLQIANNCPVHKILTSQLVINTELL